MVFICQVCKESFNSTVALGYHLQLRHDGLDSFVCGQGNCQKRFLVKSSMIRHINTYHQDLLGATSEASGESAGSVSVVREPCACVPHLDDQSEQDHEVREDLEEEAVLPIGPPLMRSVQEHVDDAGTQLLMDLRAASSLTGAAIQRFQGGCHNMLKKYSSAARQHVTQKLKDIGLSDEDISSVVGGIEIDDPFKNLRTPENQLKYFNKKFGIPIPEAKFLDSRVDKRLNPKTNSYTHTQVNESFQYISVEETLKAVLSKKSRRDMIFKDRASNDGTLRSYIDGARYRQDPFLREVEQVLHIVLYYDELEIANSLGSKTIIHKLGAFFFQILNLPPQVSSKLSTIHLAALVYADDMKKKGAFDKVLTPFVAEMNELAEGKKMKFDGQEREVKVKCAAFTADTAAAHDVLGFLGAGANHFCRWCLVHRKDVRANANAMGAPRTRDGHQVHLDLLAQNSKYSKECGVKRSCPLDEIPGFSCVENSVFDAFHDLLEGIVPLVMKLVLHHFVVREKRLTVNDLNGKLASFSYGAPDMKNKPSPNFTEKMLSDVKTKLKQTGSQMWCLCRVLPFILGPYTEESEKHMELVFLLQDIMQIIFSFEVSEEEIDHLDNLIWDHNTLFEDLFIKPEIVLDVDEGESEEESGAEEDEEDREAEEDVDDPVGEEGESRRKKKKKAERLKIYIINKLHHLKHYPEMMRLFGPAVRMWCAKFEGRLKIFRQHSAICCNFINPPKTMADMFQLSSVKSIVSDADDENPSVEHLKGWNCKLCDSVHYEMLQNLMCFDADETVTYTQSATVFGEEYRVGLFVCLPGSTNRRPVFGIIINVIVAKSKSSIILVCMPWKCLGRSQKYNTFSVAPETEERAEPLVVEASNLANFRAIAPWCSENDDVHLSLRTVMV